MIRSTRSISLALALAALALTPAPAQTEDGPPVHYRLLEGSTYQEGCWEPCDCLLLEPQPLEGSFDLVFIPVMGPIETKGVAAVDWIVPALDYEIAGSGMLQLLPGQQRLTLDLQIDDAPPTFFDSGFVPEVDPFPIIDVVISMNQFFCYDRVMHVRAAPVPSAGIDLAVDASILSWSGMSGATYDAVCGDLSILRAGAGDFTSATDLCLADDQPDETLEYDRAPDPGDGIWFLVRGADGVSPPTYDSTGPAQLGSRDAGIDASVLACP